MLVIEVSKIPAEGMDVDESLSSQPLHLDDADGIHLEDGGRLKCRVEPREARLIQVSGIIQARLRLECGRCLEPFTLGIDEKLDLAYLPRDANRGDEEEVRLEDHDLVVAYYADDRIDLGEMVREQFILNQSMRRLCREDCRGLCPQCGANRNTTACSCPPRAIDSRWEKLRSALAEATETPEEPGKTRRV
ncbi:MAG: DUF177 domain-containing protein [Vicinamibacteria bacterium]|nr:DUF177 domain-containing protein [Vicinamibacteria bacterium]